MGVNLVYISILGIFMLVIGVFGGIIVGILVLFMYNCYFNIELLFYLGFFVGKWFVLIIIGVFLIVLGVIMIFIWLLI